MSYEIEYSKEAETDLAKFKKSNPIAFKKLHRLTEEIMEHPRTGTGHPEPLKSGNYITYSRHITKKNRIVYDIYDKKASVLIISIEGHYGDK